MYLNHYKERDHVKLAKFICKRKKFKWIMSYDNVEEISTLYKSMNQISINLTYTAHIPKVGSELLIHDNTLKVSLNPNSIQTAV